MSEELTCLKFPRSVEQSLRRVPECHTSSLTDVFKPFFALSEAELLEEPVKPVECQLRMTAFVLRRTYTLREALEAGSGDAVALTLVQAAHECPSYVYRGRKE